VARYGKNVQAQTVLSQSSFYSASDPRLHFGLGAAASADLAIYWPNGLQEHISGIAANQVVTIKEGAAAAETR